MYKLYRNISQSNKISAYKQCILLHYQCIQYILYQFQYQFLKSLTIEGKMI